MTTTQRILIVVATASIALTVGTAIYQTRRASRLQDAIGTLQQQQTSLTEQIQQLQRGRDDASNRLALLAGENATLKDGSAELAGLRDEVSRLKVATQSDVAQLAAKSWLDRVTQLKQRLEQTPSAKIPELQFVTEQDWLDAAKKELKTEAHYRRALSAIRAAGEGRVASKLQKAVRAYMRDNNGQFPFELSQLQPHLDPLVNDSILQRWKIAPASDVKGLVLQGENILITQKAPVDDVFDSCFVVGSEGFGSAEFVFGEINEVMKPVWEAYQVAHNGQPVEKTSELEPYITTPEQRVAFDKLMLHDSAWK